MQDLGCHKGRDRLHTLLFSLFRLSRGWADFKNPGLDDRKDQAETVVALSNTYCSHLGLGNRSRLGYHQERLRQSHAATCGVVSKSLFAGQCGVDGRTGEGRVDNISGSKQLRT